MLLAKTGHDWRCLNCFEERSRLMFVEHPWLHQVCKILRETILFGQHNVKIKALHIFFFQRVEVKVEEEEKQKKDDIED